MSNVVIKEIFCTGSGRSYWEILDRQNRLDKAVRQATWNRSAFGAKAELRRMWERALLNGKVDERLHREILGFWYKPATDGAYV